MEHTICRTKPTSLGLGVLPSTGCASAAEAAHRKLGEQVQVRGVDHSAHPQVALGVGARDQGGAEWVPILGLTDTLEVEARGHNRGANHHL